MGGLSKFIVHCQHSSQPRFSFGLLAQTAHSAHQHATLGSLAESIIIDTLGFPQHSWRWRYLVKLATSLIHAVHSSQPSWIRPLTLLEHAGCSLEYPTMGAVAVLGQRCQLWIAWWRIWWVDVYLWDLNTKLESKSKSRIHLALV